MVDDNVSTDLQRRSVAGRPLLRHAIFARLTLQKRIQEQGALELKEILRIGFTDFERIGSSPCAGF